ncbi:probable acyl-activating enzyme 5, peroxisomal [Tanacetum coccineum]
MEQFRPSPANSSPLTPLTFLDRCATVYSDCPSIIYGPTSYTWTQTRQRCLQVASSITNLGIKRYDVVESKLVFVDYDSVGVVLEALSMFPRNIDKLRLVLITGSDTMLKDKVRAEFLCTYESMVENGDPGFEWVRPVSEWDPICLNYTSGTTSSPKGVVHSHRGMYFIAVESLIEWSVPKQPVYLWTLPEVSANGWS